MDELRSSETEPAEIVCAGTDVDPPMCIPASETESDFRDVMGALASIQKKQPDAFINVAHETGVISCVFVSLLPQRVMGSLLGELRCLDDRNDVSHQLHEVGSSCYSHVKREDGTGCVRFHECVGPFVG
eukprot:GHVU01088589.1.p1 GENE.GHVU01088589.1~~GHVU01088589.1.p1  ORF type:complete len:129 (-),score=2.87 GHVU01088589.1:64-450(-)